MLHNLLFLAGSNKFMESQFWQGLQTGIQDVTFALTIICPLICGLAALYCVIRRGIALQEAADATSWNKGIKISIICGVSGSLVSGIISLIASYFA